MAIIERGLLLSSDLFLSLYKGDDCKYSHEIEYKVDEGRNGQNIKERKGKITIGFSKKYSCHVIF